MAARKARSGLQGEGYSGSGKTVKATLEKSPIRNDHAGMDHPSAEKFPKQNTVSEAGSTQPAVSIHDNVDNRVDGIR